MDTMSPETMPDQGRVNSLIDQLRKVELGEQRAFTVFRAESATWEPLDIIFLSEDEIINENTARDRTFSKVWNVATANGLHFKDVAFVGIKGDEVKNLVDKVRQTGDLL